MKIGEYIRTPFGIRKIVDITKDEGYGKPRVKVLVLDRHLLVGVRLNYIFYTDEKVIKEAKHSFNIIDLIEVGDYVNGYKVTMLEEEYYDDVTDSVKKIKDKEKIKIILGNEEQYYGVYAKDIKSIVTKEQFESMEYKINKE